MTRIKSKDAKTAPRGAVNTATHVTSNVGYASPKVAPESATGTLMKNLLLVPKDEADEVHHSH
jgi:hypothetical protein